MSIPFQTRTEAGEYGCNADEKIESSHHPADEPRCIAIVDFIFPNLIERPVGSIALLIDGTKHEPVPKDDKSRNDDTYEYDDVEHKNVLLKNICTYIILYFEEKIKVISIIKLNDTHKMGAI